ncbi:MAG: DUF4358 domain-containing protein [Firmicutes bacterium]|nr:DUF4358 domain-containing protein [Bacillota bacterium]
MKKFILMMVIAMGITACGGNSNLTSVDINGASIALDEKLGNMSSVNEDELESIYQIDTNLMEEYVIKASDIANGNLYAIILVSEENKTEVKNQMTNYFDILVEQNVLYSPEAVNLLKNYLETSIGDYLIYISSEDNQATYNIIKEYTK